MRPVKATRKMEACMLDAEPVKTEGVEVAAGMVTFIVYDETPVPSGLAVDTGVDVGLEDEMGIVL